MTRYLLSPERDASYPVRAGDMLSPEYDSQCLAVEVQVPTFLPVCHWVASRAGERVCDSLRLILPGTDFALSPESRASAYGKAAGQSKVWKEHGRIEHEDWHTFCFLTRGKSQLPQHGAGEAVPHEGYGRGHHGRREGEDTMALTKWEPFEGLTALRREMDHLFEEFSSGGALRFWERAAEPAVEISDTAEAVVVKAQVPGVNKDDIHLTITENALTVKGEMKEEKKQDDKNYHRREFRYGAFIRTIALPAPVQAEKATAQLKDGVLEVTMPKSAPATVKQIPIQTA